MRVVVFVIVCLLLGSCKSKKESGCDAYGSVTPVHNDTTTVETKQWMLVN
jgi:hypothetical protein